MGYPAIWSHAQGGTQTPVLTGSVGVMVLVGGLEWLVGPQGNSTNIPPPTSRGPTTGQELGAYRHYTSSASLHGAMEGSDGEGPHRVASQSTLQAEHQHVPLGGPPVLSHTQGGPQFLSSQDRSVAFLGTMVGGICLTSLSPPRETSLQVSASAPAGSELLLLATLRWQRTHLALFSNRFLWTLV